MATNIQPMHTPTPLVSPNQSAEPVRVGPKVGGYLTFVVVSLFLIAVCFAIQFLSESYHTEFADHPDEAAHFVTGVMVHDYVSSSFGNPPLEFAKDYYCHYPKVAFGHWPPVFYIIQAVWYLMFGVSSISAMVLVGLISAGISILLFSRLNPVYGRAVAFACSLLFLAIPLVQQTSTIFLSDSLVGLFCLFAMFSFADFHRSGNLRHAILFSIWSSLAILTKGNALALAFLPGFAILLSGNLRLLSSWKLWLAGFVAGLFTIPFYYYFRGMMMNISGGGPGEISLFDDFLPQLAKVSVSFQSILELPVIAMVIIGGITGVVTFSKNDPKSIRFIYVCVSNATIISCFLFLIISPITNDSRYLLPAVAASIVNLAEFTFLFQQGLRRLFSNWLATAIPLVLVLMVIITYPLEIRQRATGYRESLCGLTSGNDRQTVILVSADPKGEGAVVAAQRLFDNGLKNVVCRSSKLLADETWMQNHYRLRFSETGPVGELLNEIPVHFIVMSDYEKLGDIEPPHHSLLKAVIHAAPTNYQLIRSVSVRRGEQVIPDVIQVFENVRGRGRAPRRVEVDLGYSLGETISTKLPER